MQVVRRKAAPPHRKWGIGDFSPCPILMHKNHAHKEHGFLYFILACGLPLHPFYDSLPDVQVSRHLTVPSLAITQRRGRVFSRKGDRPSRHMAYL